MATIGYETRLGASLAAELQSKAVTAAEITAERTEALLKASAARFTDSGEMEAAIKVDVYGGPGRGGGRNVGLIATCNVKHAEWVDKGTGIPGAPSIRRPNGQAMPVGARSPDRANSPQKGSITFANVVRGQEATHWFSAPGGIPLNDRMGNILRGVYRRLR